MYRSCLFQFFVFFWLCFPFLPVRHVFIQSFCHVCLLAPVRTAVYNNPTDPTSGDPLSPSFGYAGLRWAETQTALSVPKTFLAVILDTPDRPTPQPINGKPNGDPGFNVTFPIRPLYCECRRGVGIPLSRLRCLIVAICDEREGFC